MLLDESVLENDVNENDQSCVIDDPLLTKKKKENDHTKTRRVQGVKQTRCTYD